MIDLARAAIGLAFIWIAGYVCVRSLRPWGRMSAFVEWGYGHFVGVLLLGLVMRAIGALGAPLTLSVIGPTVIGAVLAVLFAARAAGRAALGGAGREAAAPVSAESQAMRFFAAFALAMIALRLGTLAVDTLLRPLFPWDAWTQWATKAKVWSQLEAYVPFVKWDDWLRGAPGYTDIAPHYPATVPLLQAWIALSIGKWDDALVNLPWLAGFVALGLGLYGQLRTLDLPRAWALGAIYAVVSLPIVDAHVALAGYADFHVAATFALAIAALVVWERRNRRVDAILAATLAGLLPLLKVPGLVWGAIVGVGILVAAFGVSWKRVAMITGVTGSAALLFAVLLWREKIASVAANLSNEVLGSIADNLFLFDNWHLLWYVLPLLVIAGWRDAVTRMRGATVALACGGAFLVAIFAGTSVSAWVIDYTTVNRALLHIAPAVTVFSAVALWHWSCERSSAARRQASAPAGVAQEPVEIVDGAGQAVAQLHGGRPAE